MLAFNSAGFVAKVSLTDIYEKAAEALNVPRATITAAEY